jgi:Tat protein translocase TatB subunit
MFDISFSELALILVVGLVVFGPEKLPEVVRTASLWIGKMRRSFTSMRAEIEREIGMNELKNAHEKFEECAAGFPTRTTGISEVAVRCKRHSATC